MCTIIIATRWVTDIPLVVGANREERYQRPAAPPAILDTSPTVFAPVDREAGGTWIGINEHGLFVAVTNRKTPTSGTRSRGWLVRDALTRQGVPDALEYVTETFETHDYRGCYLLLADSQQATVIAWDGERVDYHLDPGIHVITNDGINEQAVKSAIVRTRAQLRAQRAPDEWVSNLPELLRDQPLGVCRHGEKAGTRSSSLVQFDADGGLRYQFANGPPDTTDFQVVHEGEL